MKIDRFFIKKKKLTEFSKLSVIVVSDTVDSCDALKSKYIYLILYWGN
jgi:hypothetical protein